VRSLLLRLAGFGSLPLIASLSPLLVLGVVARACSPDEWAALGIGQAVGSFATVAVTFGWTMVGPPAVATAASPDDRRDLYVVSWWVRVGAATLVIPAAVVLSVVLAPSAPVLAAAMCTSTALTGLSMAWFAVGIGRPRTAAAFDVLPRLAALAAGAVAVVVTAEPVWFPVCAGAGTLLALHAFHRRLIGRLVPPWPGWASVLRALRRSAPGAAVMSVGSVYTSAPVPVASLIGAADQVARMSSADRVYRYSLFAVSSLADALQSWVLERGVRDRRQSVAIVGHAVLASAGGGALVLLGPLATELLFGAALGSSRAVFAGYGLAFFFVCLSTPFVRNILVPLGHARAVLAANVAGLVTGASVLVPATAAAGVPGVSLAFAATEGVTMGYVIVRAVVAWRAAARG